MSRQVATTLTDTSADHSVSLADGVHTCPSNRIAGHVSTGMLDWPGLVSTTVFVSGCPLRCPYCHNPDLLVPHSTTGEWERALVHLSARRGWIDGVVLTGGEPTSDPDILPLLETLAARGLRVKLDTNGVAPRVLASILDSSLVDYVALDVKTFPDRYHLLGAPKAAEAVCESIALLLDFGVRHEFRTTVYPPLIECDELPALALLLAGGDLYALQQFRPDRTLDPAASSVDPASPLELLAAAERCGQSLPTITRGV